MDKDDSDSSSGESDISEHVMETNICATSMNEEFEIRPDQNQQIHGADIGQSLADLQKIVRKSIPHLKGRKSKHNIEIVINQCRELQKKFELYQESVEQTHKDSSQKYISRLAEQARRIDELTVLNENKDKILEDMKQKCALLEKLQGENEALNEYIERFDKHHVEEVGRLKAKLSLTRMEEEMKKNEREKKVEDEDGGKTRPRRVRRLSIFRRKMRSGRKNEDSVSTGEASHENHSSSMEELLQKIDTKVVMRELEKLCTELESRSLVCHDLKTENVRLEHLLEETNCDVDRLNTEKQKLQATEKKWKAFVDTTSEKVSRMSHAASLIVKEIRFHHNEQAAVKSDIIDHQRDIKLVLRCVKHMMGVLDERDKYIDSLTHEATVQEKTWRHAPEKWSELADVIIKMYLSTKRSNAVKREDLSKALLGDEGLEVAQDMVEKALEFITTIQQQEDPKSESKDTETQTTETNLLSSNTEETWRNVAHELKAKLEESTIEVEKEREAYEKKLKSVQLRLRAKIQELEMHNDEIQMEMALAKDALEKRGQELRTLNELNSRLRTEKEDVQKKLKNKIERYEATMEDLEAKNLALRSKCDELEAMLDDASTPENSTSIPDHQSPVNCRDQEMNCAKQATDQLSTDVHKSDVVKLSEDVQRIHDRLNRVCSRTRSHGTMPIANEYLHGIHQPYDRSTRRHTIQNYRTEPRSPTVYDHYQISSNRPQTSSKSLFMPNTTGHTNHIPFQPHPATISPPVRPISSSHFTLSSMTSSSTSRLSAANHLIATTFEEGHSLIEQIFDGQERLQIEMQRAREARRRSSSYFQPAHTAATISIQR